MIVPFTFDHTLGGSAEMERPPSLTFFADEANGLTGKPLAVAVAEERCIECGCEWHFHDEGGFCAGPCGGDRCCGRTRDPVAFHATQDPISDADAPRLGASASLGVQQGLTVRRLTPLERERLMDWPDDWTAFGLDEEGGRVEMSDTTRDRMTGNGVVMPIGAWLAQRIAAVD